MSYRCPHCDCKHFDEPMRKLERERDELDRMVRRNYQQASDMLAAAIKRAEEAEAECKWLKAELEVSKKDDVLHSAEPRGDVPYNMEPGDD